VQQYEAEYASGSLNSPDLETAGLVSEALSAFRYSFHCKVHADMSAFPSWIISSGLFWASYFLQGVTSNSACFPLRYTSRKFYRLARFLGELKAQNFILQGKLSSSFARPGASRSLKKWGKRQDFLLTCVSSQIFILCFCLAPWRRRSIAPVLPSGPLGSLAYSWYYCQTRRRKPSRSQG